MSFINIYFYKAQKMLIQICINQFGFQKTLFRNLLILIYNFYLLCRAVAYLYAYKPVFSEILSFLITVALGIPVISEIEEAFMPIIFSFDKIINLAHSRKFSYLRSFE